MSAPSAESTSSSLLRRVKSSDQAAWAELVRTYGPLVYAWCRKAKMTEHDAGDVVQNVFAAVHRSIDKFRRERDGDSFRGWLWTVTRNEVVSLLRKQDGQPQAVGGTTAQLHIQQLPEEFSSDKAPEDDGEQYRLLRRALVNLRPQFDEKTWQAFWRTAVDGQKSADVAEELGLAATTVREYKRRVLKQLWQYMADD